MNAAKYKNLGFELLVNFLLPWLVYHYSVASYGETGGLILSALPPLLWSVVELWRFKRVDALSVMVLIGIVLSLAAMVLGGEPRMLLMRESLVSGLIGLAFLVSLAWRRPLIFYLARASLARAGRQTSSPKPGASSAATSTPPEPTPQTDPAGYFELRWQQHPGVAQALKIMSLVWGLGLVGETLLRAWLAWTWPVERFLLVTPFLSYGIFGGLMAWTFWYRGYLRRKAA